MGDAWIGIQHARNLGDMLTGQEGSYTGPARYCSNPKCRAKLRQNNHGRLCAPCDAKANPSPTLEDTTTRTLPYGDAICAWCEHPYKKRHPKQLYCSMRCSEHVHNYRKRQNRNRQSA